MSTLAHPELLADPANPRRDPAQAPDKVDLFGVGVSVAEPDAVCETVLHWAADRRSAIVDFMPVHGLIEAVRDKAHRQRMNRFDIVACDGQPIRWSLNRFHNAQLQERVYGPHTMHRLCGEAAERGIGVYLYGGRPEVLETLSYKLLEDFPDLKIVGAESPPFRPLTEDEDAAAVRRINASGAGLVFLGIGCPRQEIFAADHRELIHGVQLCVGAAFDFHAGAVKMAPPWMQKRGLEWLYRLCKEPRRLFKRYAVTNSLFIMLVFKRMLLGR